MKEKRSFIKTGLLIIACLTIGSNVKAVDSAEQIKKMKHASDILWGRIKELLIPDETMYMMGAASMDASKANSGLKCQEQFGSFTPQCHQSSLSALGESQNHHIGMGMKISPKMRTELEISQKKEWDVDNYQIDSLSSMANLYIDLTSEKVKEEALMIPYIKAGIGMAQTEIKSKEVRMAQEFSPGILFEKSDKNPIWILGAGLSSYISENILFDIGYKRASLGDGFQGKAIQTDEITTGLRIEF